MIVESRIIFPYYRNCKLCGKEFYSKDRRRVYCSKECSDYALKHYMSDWYKQTHVKKEFCVICGNKLPMRRSKYCSNKCYIIAQSKRDRNMYKKVNKRSTCVVCEKSLPKYRSKYCSNTCYKIVQNKRRK